jgi:hypothetical protein
VAVRGQVRPLLGAEVHPRADRSAGIRVLDPDVDPLLSPRGDPLDPHRSLGHRGIRHHVPPPHLLVHLAGADAESAFGGPVHLQVPALADLLPALAPTGLVSGQPFLSRGEQVVLSGDHAPVDLDLHRSRGFSLDGQGDLLAGRPDQRVDLPRTQGEPSQGHGRPFGGNHLQAG